MCLPGPDEPDPLSAHLLHWEGWGDGAGLWRPHGAPHPPKGPRRTRPSARAGIAAVRPPRTPSCCRLPCKRWTLWSEQFTHPQGGDTLPGDQPRTFTENLSTAVQGHRCRPQDSPLHPHTRHRAHGTSMDPATTRKRGQSPAGGDGARTHNLNHDAARGSAQQEGSGLEVPLSQMLYHSPHLAGNSALETQLTATSSEQPSWALPPLPKGSPRPASRWPLGTAPSSHSELGGQKP